MPTNEHFRTEIERLSNQRIHPRAFDIEPVGSRLVVVVDGIPESHKGIHIPESARGLPGGGGWVIAVGQDVGKHGIPYPGGPRLDKPEDLLGEHLLFGAHIGVTMKFSFIDRDFKGVVLVMSDRDILAIDKNPEAAAAEVRER